jgi:hypothetical protein
MLEDFTTGKTYQWELFEGWQSWIKGFAPWSSFVTLTFKDFQTRDQAEHAFRFLLRVMNTDLFGNHYSRIVGHNYCAYVVGFETQTRGALHMHVLFDRPVNYSLIHSIWCGDPKKPRFGFAWIKPVDDVDGAVSYLSKYVTKNGDLLLYKPAEVKQPAFVPYWFDPSTIDIHHLPLLKLG